METTKAVIKLPENDVAIAKLMKAAFKAEQRLSLL